MTIFNGDTANRVGVSVLVLIVLVSFLSCNEAEETLTIEVGGHPFRIELAVSPEDRQKGLMFRHELAPDAGMLFVFPDSALRSFWMKDTSIPLSIAFISAGGRILEIHELEPYSLAPVRSRFPARYALEVNRGRFTELGIEPGDRIELEKLPASLRP